MRHGALPSLPATHRHSLECQHGPAQRWRAQPPSPTRAAKQHAAKATPSHLLCTLQLLCSGRRFSCLLKRAPQRRQQRRRLRRLGRGGKQARMVERGGRPAAAHAVRQAFTRTDLIEEAAAAVPVGRGCQQRVLWSSLSTLAQHRLNSSSARYSLLFLYFICNIIIYKSLYHHHCSSMCS